MGGGGWGDGIAGLSVVWWREQRVLVSGSAQRACGECLPPSIPGSSLAFTIFLRTAQIRQTLAGGRMSPLLVSAASLE